MNFLAHLLLAKPTSVSQAGNFLGDFIKGTPESLAETLPADLLHGIMMHRHVDVFTDAHPAFKEGKTLLKKENRRFSGIVLDIFTDHFLARNWKDYATETLSAYNEKVNKNLREHWEYFPEDAREVAQSMYEHEWFQTYLEVEGVEYVLQRLGSRKAAFHPIRASFSDFTEHYGEYEKLSHKLLKDAVQFSKTYPEK